MKNPDDPIPSLLYLFCDAIHAVHRVGVEGVDLCRKAKDDLFAVGGLGEDVGQPIDHHLVLGGRVGMEDLVPDIMDGM